MSAWKFRSITALIVVGLKSTFAMLNRMNDLIDCAKTTGSVVSRPRYFDPSMEVSELRRHIGWCSKPNLFHERL